MYDDNGEGFYTSLTENGVNTNHVSSGAPNSSR